MIENIKQQIIDFYNKKESVKKKKIDFECKYITNYNPGLGDCLSVSHLPKLAFEQNKEVYIHSPSPHFGSLVQFNPYYKTPPQNKKWVRAEILQGEYDCGNGHFFQRLQRACGLKPDLVPKPVVERIYPSTKDVIVLCLNVGAHAENQRRTIHPRARQLYDEHRITLQNFINDNRHKYHFIEIGTEFSGLRNVENKCGLPLNLSILELNKAEYFIGLHSGVMHLAAGLDIKSIVLINFPSAKELYLPLMKDIGICDADWLYPSGVVYLHMDEDGPLVKYFNRENLEKAIAGLVYPFWSEQFVDLINYKF